MIPPQPQRVLLLQPLTESFLDNKEIITSFVATHNNFLCQYKKLPLNFYAGRCKDFARRAARRQDVQIQVARRGETSIAGVWLFQMVPAVFLIILVPVAVVAEAFIVGTGQR